MVLFDALEFPFGERGEESPGQRQRIFDRALGLALVEEPSLELFGEFQVEAIAIRERFLSDDRHQFAQVDAVGVGGVELVAQRAVVLARAALADAVVHQPGKAAQRSNRRVEPQPVQLAAEQNLSFRDVACQVGDGVRDIVVGHRQDWQLRDRPLAVMNTPGAFVNRGQVGVHVARVAAAAGDLFAGSADFAQTFAIVCHIAEDDQHLHIHFKGKEFSGRQGDARRDEALDGGVVGQIEEHHRAGQRPRGLELVDEERRLALGDAHGREHDGELLLAAQDLGLPGDLRGNLVVRQSRAAKDGKFLSPHQRVQAVDRRDAGLNELLRTLPGDGIDGRSDDRQPLFGDERRQSVDRLAQAAEPAADHLLGYPEPRHVLAQADRGLSQVQPGRLLEDLDHRVFLGHLDHLAAAHGLVG